MKKIFKIAALLLVSILFTACSFNKPYPNTLKKNFIVYTNKQSNQALTNVDVNLHIWRYKNCTEKSYLGTVALEDSTATRLGLPVNQWLELIVEFQYSVAIRSMGSITQSYFVKPRAGYRYSVNVEHHNGIYNVEIFETNIATKRTKEIYIPSLEGC